MKAKKVISFALVCITLASLLCVCVSARYINVTAIKCDLSFSGRVATCSGNITALSGSTIDATLTLYRKNGSNWDYVTSWTKYSAMPVLNFSNEKYTVPSAGTYKVVITATVTRNGVAESVSNESAEKTCS